MKFLILPFLFLFINTVIAQGDIIIIGNGYAFTVSDPGGWTRDMRNAKNIYANVLYHPIGKGISVNTTMILVTLVKKKGDGIYIMMENEMSDYMKEKPDVQYEVLEIPHTEYITNSQCAYIKGDFYHYATYIDPGEDIKHGLSIVMMVPRDKANAGEMDVYKDIISSMVVHPR